MMGLSLQAVSIDYHYDEDIHDYVGEEGTISSDIGYISYKIFRDDLVSFATNNKIKSIDDYYCGEKLTLCWYDEKTFEVAMEEIGFKDEEYILRLEQMKREYPKLYDIFPFVEHCDCEGTMPYTQIEKVLPVLEEFNKQKNKKYGYSAYNYDFAEDLVEIMKEVISMKGKLYFY
jgi:hypothetical protein